MVRRPVAWIVAAVLFVEAFGVALLNWFLGMVVDRQDMSLAGLDPHTMAVSSKAAGVAFGIYFALCGLAALLTAVRDRSPSGIWRILLISAAVVHGLLGAFAIGLVGWGAFAFMMVVLGLILLTLMTYDRQQGTAGAPPAGTGPEADEGAQGEPREAAPSEGETPGTHGNGGPAPVTP
ncbi:hypothetical protein [Streptomyces sp. NPDC001020]